MKKLTYFFMFSLALFGFLVSYAPFNIAKAQAYNMPVETVQIENAGVDGIYVGETTEGSGETGDAQDNQIPDGEQRPHNGNRPHGDRRPQIQPRDGKNTMAYSGEEDKKPSEDKAVKDGKKEEAKKPDNSSEKKDKKSEKANISDSAKASLLMDYATGTVIYSKNETERLPIASMMKIMTVLLTLEEIDKGNIKLDDKVTVSENAASQGGSQVFLDANEEQTVGALLESIIVASANDSCVALAEHISGSVEGFVAKMNERAEQLKMDNTHFANCTGLPSPENYSCAKDVATMTRELVKHPTYFEYSKVWLKDFEHNSERKTTMTNTNKLIRFYKGCDGGKTGFTNEAGFCLSATAERDGMRLIGVVIGEKDSKTRFKDASNMLNYGFANYENKVYLDTETEIKNDIELKKSKQDTCKIVVDSPLVSFAKRGDESGFEIKYELPKSIKAPKKKGEKIGKAYLVKDGVVVDESNVVLKENLDKSSLLDDLKKLFGLHK